MATTTPIDLTVIIVNWNTRELLADCLKSIYEYNRSLTLQVIVVDNQSHDASADMVQKEFPQTLLIQAGDNLGFSKANNLGLRQAQGRYVLFLNPDTLFIDDSLMRCLRFVWEHPAAGLVGCRLLNADRSLQKGSFISLGLFCTLFVNLGLHVFLPNAWRRRLFLVDRDYDHVQKIDWMRGAFMLIEREKLDRVGFFDENLFMYAEDLDLCLRVKQAGWQNYYCNECAVIHYGNASAQHQFGDRRLQAVFKSLDYVYRKHYGLHYTRRYLNILAITSWLKALRYRCQNALTHQENDHQQYLLQRNMFTVCRERIRLLREKPAD